MCIKGRPNLFFRYLSMFLLVLILPVGIMGIVIHTNVRTVLWKEIKASTQAAAQQVVSSLEQHMIDMDALASMLITDTDVRTMASVMPLPRATLGKTAGVLKMNMYIKANAFIQRVMVCKGGQILSSEGVLMNSEVDAIRQILLKRDGQFVWDVDLLSDNIYYIRKLSILYDQGEQLVFEIPRSMFVKLVSTLPHAGEIETLVLENRSNVVFSTLKGGPIPGVIENARPGQWNRFLWNGKSYLIYTAEIQKMNLSALFLLPEDVLSAPLKQALLFLEIYLLTAAVAGVVLSLLFSYRNYKPLQPILHDYKPPEGTAPGRSGLEIISYVYDRAKRDNIELRDRMEKQRSSASRHFMLNLLRGRYLATSDLERLARQYGLTFAHPHFRLLLVMGHNLPSYQRESLCEERMQEIIHRYLAGQAPVCLAIDVGCIAVIINAAEAQTLEEELIAASVAIIDDILHQLSLNVTIGVSEQKEDLAALHQAYMEAESACEYRLICGNNQVILFRDVEDLTHDVSLRYVQAFRNQSDIQRHLENGNYDAVERDINSLFQEIEQSKISVSLARCLYYEIVNLVLRTLPYPLIKCVDIRRMLSMDTLDGLREQTLSIYRMACDAPRDAVRVKNHVEKAIEHIHACYADTTLSSESIADALAISRSYLSRLFSQEMHIPISEYISRVRIQKACTMLFDASLSLTQIAQEVGYADLHTFLRNFKKYTGMTPTQYKEQKLTAKPVLEEKQNDH